MAKNQEIKLYTEWKEKVEDLLVKEEVPKLTHNQSPLTIIINRGDESFQCWELGDTPAEYVQFLKSEYEIYGPDGE